MKKILIILVFTVMLFFTLACSKKATAPEEPVTPPEITYLGADVSYNEVAGKYTYHLYFEIGNTDTLAFFHYTHTLTAWYWEADQFRFPPSEEEKWHTYPAGKESPYALEFKFTGNYNSGLLAIIKAKNKTGEAFASIIVNEERIDVAPELVATQPATTK